MVLAPVARAEDIDIYVDNAGTTGSPNVLFIFDNGANFSSNATNTCTYVDDGAVPSLGSTGGGVEQCTLYNTVYALKPDTVNIGLMVFESTKMRDIANVNCGNTTGGCLVQPIIPMTGPAKTAFLAWIRKWGTTVDIKSSGDRTGAVMQEAWARNWRISPFRQGHMAPAYFRVAITPWVSTPMARAYMPTSGPGS